MASSEGIKIADRRASHMVDVPASQTPTPAPTPTPAAQPAARQPSPASPQQPSRPQPRPKPRQEREVPSDPRMQQDLPEDEFEGPFEDEEDMGGEEEMDPRAQAARGRQGGPGPMALFAAPVREISSYFLEILLRKAWVCLGMMPDPMTGRRKANPAEARLAIDLVSGIADQMSGKWGHPGMEAELRNQLTNLRLHLAKTAGEEPASV